MLDVGPLFLGESAVSAFAAIGRGTKAVWADRYPAVACRDGQAFLALKLRAGRVVGIVVAHVHDAPLVMSVTFDSVAALRTCRSPIASMNWLGHPVYSGAPRTLPDGWAVDPKPDALVNNGRDANSYLNPSSPYRVLRENGGPIGWILYIIE